MSWKEGFADLPSSSHATLSMAPVTVSDEDEGDEPPPATTMRLNIGTSGAYLLVWAEELEMTDGEVAFGFNGTFHAASGDVAYLVDSPSARLARTGWCYYDGGPCSRPCFSWVLTVPSPEDGAVLPQRWFGDFNNVRVRGTSKRAPPFSFVYADAPDETMFFKERVLCQYGDEGDRRYYSISDVSEDEDVLVGMGRRVKRTPLFCVKGKNSTREIVLRDRVRDAAMRRLEVAPFVLERGDRALARSRRAICERMEERDE